MTDTSNLAGDVDANGDVVDELREALKTALETNREATAARDRGEATDAVVALTWEVVDDLVDLWIEHLGPPRPPWADRLGYLLVERG